MFIDHRSAKVSIILTTYNGAKHIAETVESIRNQTWVNWELIIVDDGSEDDTAAVIAGIKDERIQFLLAGRSGINGKVKNLGLSKASGDLIAFIDHDDLWDLSKLEKQIAALQQYPEAGFCLTGGYNFRKTGEPIEHFYKQKNGIKRGNIFISLFNSEIAGFSQALMFRKECLAVAGHFKEVNSFADLDFIINLSRHFDAIILYESLVYRRLHDKSHSHLNWEKGYFEGLELIQSYKDDNLLPSKVVRNAFFRLYINFGEDCLQHREQAKAVKHFFYAWTYKFFSVVPVKKIVKAILFF